MVSVFLSQRRELHTTHTWEYLGLESKLGVVDEDSAWTKGKFGQDTIIATLDTGFHLVLFQNLIFEEFKFIYGLLWNMCVLD